MGNCKLHRVLIFRQCQSVMLFHADLGGRQKSMGDGEHPGFSIAMPVPTVGNGFEAEIDGRQMGAGGDPGLTQDGSTIQPAEPRSVLKNGKLVPRTEGNDGRQHRRKVFRLAQHAAPFVQPVVLVPVEIIEQRIGRSTAELFGSFDRGFRVREDRIDGGIVDAGEIFRVITILPLAFLIYRGDAPGERVILAKTSPDLSSKTAHMRR